MARYDVDIDAPADRVYALIAEVRQRTQWLPELDAADAPNRPLEKGDRFDGRVSLLGHQFIGTSDVVDAVPGERIEERVVIGASFRTTWLVTPSGDDSCHVEHLIEVQFPGGVFGRIERWVLARRLDRLQRSALKRLREAAAG